MLQALKKNPSKACLLKNIKREEVEVDMRIKGMKDIYTRAKKVKIIMTKEEKKEHFITTHLKSTTTNQYLQMR